MQMLHQHDDSIDLLEVSLLLFCLIALRRVEEKDKYVTSYLRAVGVERYCNHG